jgi:hypothetical protein
MHYSMLDAIDVEALADTRPDDAPPAGLQLFISYASADLPQCRRAARALGGGGVAGLVR